MLKIGFVRSRKPYTSYADFWTLVERSGFEIAWADQADLSEKGWLWIWPTMNMEFLGRVLVAGARRAAKVAWWYLERPDANLGPDADPKSAFRAMVGEALDAVDAVWVSDRSLHAVDPRTVFAALGGHPALRLEPDLPKRWDVAFMGQRTPRRVEVIAAMEKRGLAVTPDGYGLERARALASSRLSLVVDRTGGMPVANPIRWALAAAYGLGILQEDHPDPHPLVPGYSVAQAPVAALPQLACELVASGAWKTLGEKAAQVLLVEHPFRVGVERAAEACL